MAAAAQMASGSDIREEEAYEGDDNYQARGDETLEEEISMILCCLADEAPNTMKVWCCVSSDLASGVMPPCVPNAFICRCLEIHIHYETLGLLRFPRSMLLVLERRTLSP